MYEKFAVMAIPVGSQLMIPPTKLKLGNGHSYIHGFDDGQRIA